MSSAYQNRAQAYHKAIRTALLKDWDPIGIKEIPEAEDEYDSYVPTIYKMLISRKSKHEVFDFLWWLETEHMGLIGDRQATERFTERLMSLPDEVDRALR